MTEAGTLLSTSAGVALIGLVGRDAFDALFHAEGRGTFSRQLTRAVWWVFRRAGTRHGLFSIAGPVALVTVIATWALEESSPPDRSTRDRSATPYR